MKYFERIIFYLTIFLFITALAFYCHNVDIDLWARLLQGDYVLKTGHVMYADPYSYVKVHPWIDHEWGSGTIFSLIRNHFGYLGLIILKAFLMIVSIFFTIRTIKINGLKSTKLYNLLFFFFVINSFETILLTGIRCHYFSFAFFAIYLYILESARVNNRNKLLYFIPLIMILWANLHGGCVAGIGLLFMYTIGEALNKRPYKKYLYTLIATIPTLLINPYGFEYIKFLLHANTMQRAYIAEWGNIFGYTNILFKAKIFSLLALITFCSSIYKNYKTPNRPNYTKYIVITTTCVLACLHIKLLPFFIISATVFLYDDFYAIFNEFIFKLRNLLKITSEKFIKIFVVIKEIIVYCFIIFGSLGLLYSNYSNTISENILAEYPVKTTEFMKINNLSGRILNNFSIGSYLAYKLYPQNLIHMDGRYEEVYYDDTFEDNHNFFYNSAKIVDNKLVIQTSYNVFTKDGFPEYIIANKKDFILPVLYNMPNYKDIFDKENYVLFSRTDILRDVYKQPSDDNNYYITTFFDKFQP